MSTSTNSDKINIESNEVTLKELLFISKKYIKELLKYWWVIAILSFCFVGYNVYKTFTTKSTYIANARFIIETNGNSGGIGGIGGILGNIGIGKNSGFNSHKLLEVAKSARIMSKILLDTLENENDILANLILDNYNVLESILEEYPELKGYNFEKNDFSTFDRQERQIFMMLVSRILGTPTDRSEALLTISIDVDSRIYTISSTTEKEEISIELANKMYDYIKDFFENKTLESLINTKEVLEFKKDSIRSVINRINLEAAKFEDRNRGMFLQETKVTKRNLENEVAGNMVAYQEIFKNYELADYNLRVNRPIFLKIDTPVTPLEMKSPSLVLNILLALIASGLISAIIIIGRRIILDSLSE